MQPFTRHTGLLAADGPRQRRHRPDHPQAVSQADRADRIRPVPVLRLAIPGRRCAAIRIRFSISPSSRGEPSCWRGAISAAARAASMPLGPGGLWLSRCHRAELRRHLLQQLLQERTLADPAERGRVDDLFARLPHTRATSSRRPGRSARSPTPSACRSTSRSTASAATAS